MYTAYTIGTYQGKTAPFPQLFRCPVSFCDGPNSIKIKVIPFHNFNASFEKRALYLTDNGPRNRITSGRVGETMNCPLGLLKFDAIFASIELHAMPAEHVNPPALTQHVCRYRYTVTGELYGGKCYFADA